MIKGKILLEIFIEDIVMKAKIARNYVAVDFMMNYKGIFSQQYLTVVSLMVIFVRAKQLL
jgi:hypothetical protein